MGRMWPGLGGRGAGRGSARFPSEPGAFKSCVRRVAQNPMTRVSPRTSSARARFSELSMLRITSRATNLKLASPKLRSKMPFSWVGLPRLDPACCLTNLKTRGPSALGVPTSGLAEPSHTPSHMPNGPLPTARRTCTTPRQPDKKSIESYKSPSSPFALARVADGCGMNIIIPPCRLAAITGLASINQGSKRRGHCIQLALDIDRQHRRRPLLASLSAKSRT